jgi:hypothetical protein
MATNHPHSITRKSSVCKEVKETAARGKRQRKGMNAILNPLAAGIALTEQNTPLLPNV